MQLSHQLQGAVIGFWQSRRLFATLAKILPDPRSLGDSLVEKVKSLKHSICYPSRFGCQAVGGWMMLNRYQTAVYFNRYGN